MRTPKASKRSKSEDERQLETEWAGVDFEHAEPTQLELDPMLHEQIRRDRLVQLTLRLGSEQIAEARRVAAETNEKYQQVLRRWIAEGASRTQTKRQKHAG